MLKRVFDIMFSLIGLLIFLPFGLIIAAVLRFTGEGEIFFIQPRVGKSGRKFPLIKFATMLKESPNLGTGLLTINDDPRILPVGRVLRKTKLNEVPQLINVLLGHMSIIGPRPQAEAHFMFYPEPIRRELIKVQPGMSGIGSVVFRDEENILGKSGKEQLGLYQNDIAIYKGEIEAWYVCNMSLGLDALLVLLTIWAILFPSSKAYKRFCRNLPENTNPNLYL